MTAKTTELKSPATAAAPPETPAPNTFAYSGKGTYVLLPRDTVEQRKIKDQLDKDFERLEHPPLVVDILPAGMLSDRNVVYVAALTRGRGKLGPDRFGQVETVKVYGPFLCSEHTTEDQYGISTLSLSTFMDKVQMAIKDTKKVVKRSADKDHREVKIFLAGS